jgi:hypothetical protein
LLDEGQRSKVLFEFDDAAQRKRWSNLPMTMVPRAGLKMGDLSGPQRTAAMGLLAATLSQRGYDKVLAIRSCSHAYRAFAQWFTHGVPISESAANPDERAETVTVPSGTGVVQQ